MGKNGDGGGGGVGGGFGLIWCESSRWPCLVWTSAGLSRLRRLTAQSKPPDLRDILASVIERRAEAASLEEKKEGKKKKTTRA